LVYNTFPLPPKDASLSRLTPLAQAILDARAAHPGATLADLYDPLTMPPSLRKAHQALDRAVDRLYRRSGFASERERVECLLMMYEGLREPLGVGITGKKKRRRGRASGISH
ncbi:MAG: class I SAM-dependent DNA methyltransferase, partial [Cyanobacteria bacterium MAG CAR2_bin_4]|nr:class I SAM-dependent DNA methyltransferase [Cyanobacteria bacterium MAG CAR2_bin_4]